MKLTPFTNTSENYSNLPKKGFESFFVSSWEAWDLLDTSAFYFYDCVLAIDLPGYPKGSKISGMTLDLEANLVEFDIKELEEDKFESLAYTISIDSIKII